MKHTYHIKMRAVFWAMLGVACFVSAPAMAEDWRRSGSQKEAVCQDSCGGGCGPCPSDSGNSGGGEYNEPKFRNLFRNLLRSSGPSAADKARQQRLNEEAEAAAAAERQRQQAEEALIERERVAEEKRKNDEIKRLARDTVLSGSSGMYSPKIQGITETDKSGSMGRGDNALKDAVRDSSPLVGDTHAKQNVPSGLPKGLDNAIASHYANAPPGVSDRVRKGFQAVMERDWKVAKAWFQDALNRDPTNAGLKRLVALTDSSQQPDLQSATVDARNEPPNKPKPASTTNPNLQLPDPDDIRFLFPGLQAMKDREAPVFKTLPDGRVLQMPQDSDMEFLFGPAEVSSASPAPTPTFIIGKGGQLIPVPENSDQKSTTYIKGKDGKLIEVPQPHDILLMFPGNSPAITPKPAVESGKTK